LSPPLDALPSVEYRRRLKTRDRRRVASFVLKVLAYTGAVLLTGYIGLCWLLYAQQGRMIYPGTTDANPAGFTALHIKSDAADLKVWVLHPNAGPALLYFGGNGEDLGAGLPDFDKAFPERAIYFMNYRGYGGSTGSPSESALIADAQATYDVIRKTHDRVAVMGRSLGSGVASALAVTRPVEKVILVTPFDSVSSVAAERIRWAPVRWLIKDKFDSLTRISAVRAPTFVVIAARDESIPRAHSDALLAAIPSALRHSIVIPNGTHNDLGDYQQYLKIVRDFLAAE
jgi:pimeloyl-ACP methyl ester carboxylesterase